ncbi:CLUMA_CG008039, isoform A [Clunio marinus]|uniref:CLUMA_CG008039, isoform A n=1 Tax=Clunio marinus TaxID=568069 RepID=A0A1J1I2K5_9DIPT|nr:CLUMA_CG008039, isoform A [Clunio marinus]
MEFVKQEVYNLDGNTQLEFLNQKTIIVIDKDRFLVCKQFLIENAPDEDFAAFLNIPIEKVRYFKYKMQLFEDTIRVRRRAAVLEKQRKRLLKVNNVRKREISSEERFRRARELIARNLSTNQISKILKVSERSVTRFKQRMREEKRKLKAEGKISFDPNDPDDENNFKFLKPEEKIKKAKELFRKRLKIQEISEILKISERSVRRWKDRLGKLKEESHTASKIIEEQMKGDNKSSKRPTRMDSKLKQENVNETDEDVIEEEELSTPNNKKRRLTIDREKVQYAKELIENKLSNKEMSMLLEMSIACVRKLKMKILDGTVEELIDNSEEHYTKLEKIKDDNLSDNFDPDTDPLTVSDLPYYNSIGSTSLNNYSYERKPKIVLSDRDMHKARLLRENNIRTMDIAKMMKISERSVTRLLAKSRHLEFLECESDVFDEVNKLLEEKDEILNSDDLTDMVVQETEIQELDDPKRQLAFNLLAMNVKVKDISRMLDVSEVTVSHWKSQMTTKSVGGSHNVKTRHEEPQEIIVCEEYEEYE